MKNLSKRIPLESKVVLMSILAAIAMHGISAEELTGIVVDKREDNLDTNLYIRVNAKRPYDHIIKILSSQMSNSLGNGLDMMIEKGSIIVFEDEGMLPNNTARRGDQKRIISIDGISVLDMFPDRQNAFPYAQAAALRNQQSTGRREDNKSYRDFLAHAQPNTIIRKQNGHYGRG